MNLGFFTMPIHPLDKDWRQSLSEDREAFLLADELGFTEAYVGEHVTDKAENITSCVTFLAWIAAATKQIRLGTALQSSRQVLDRVHAAYADQGNRPRLYPPSAATTASADRRHRSRTVFEGRDRSRSPGMGSDLGKLPDAGLGEEPLAQICGRL